MYYVKTIIFSILIIMIFPSITYSSSIVDTTKKVYSYEEMLEDINQLEKTYSDIIEYESIGKTKFNRDIVAVKLGKGKKNIYINGSHHAREWISTVLIMEMIETYAKSYQENNFIESFSAYDILNEVSIWFVPMVNPDGVTLQQKGLKAFPKNYHYQLLKMNGWSNDFTRWKANAEGIDLNRQYPANWNKNIGIYRPRWAGFKGDYPFQTNEVKAMRDFTYKIQPEIAVSYHSSGRILYWYFHNKKENYERDLKLAKQFSNITGYSLVSPSRSKGGKGYTDWFIQEFNKPGFTPELSYSVGERHVPMSLYPEIWRRNKVVGLWLAAESYHLLKSTQASNVLNETLEIYTKKMLYKEPSLLKSSNEFIKPQKIEALKSIDNWYYVKAKDQNGWIYLPNDLKNFPERSFIDVSKNHWAKTEIDIMKEKKWMYGKGQDKFSPNESLTRSELAVILVRVLKLPISNPKNVTFKDVNREYWAYSYIETVAKHGLINGYSDGMYKPSDVVTREQIAVILSRLFNEELNNKETPFKDVNINRWSSEAVMLMKSKGIMVGVSKDFFGVNQQLTRAETAVILTRLANKYPILTN